jgi:hypothetical protein
MVNVRFPVALAAVALALALPAAAADSAHVFSMGAQNGSGEAGTVALVPMGDKTEVIVSLTGAPAGVAQPVHVHDGSCAKLNPKPTYPLTTMMNGVSVTTIDAPIAKLTGGGFAVNAHKSTTEIGTYVSCGDLSSK